MASSERRTGFTQLVKEHELYPQEAPAMLKTSKMKMYIGIPKETSFQENRLALTPHAIGLLVNNGHEIFVESGAGNPSKYSDTDYSEMGALIVQTAEEAYKADYILKVEPPTEEEFKFLRPGQTLFSAIQSTTIKLEYLKGLINKRINAIAFEYIKDESNTMPIVRSMSEVVQSCLWRQNY